MRFAALIHQEGGCDYSIECGTLLVYLPKDIHTMDEAYAFVTNVNVTQEEIECDTVRGVLARYRNEFDIDNCTILEINNQVEVDIKKYRAIRDEMAKRLKDDASKEARQEQYEKLKKEFG